MGKCRGKCRGDSGVARTLILISFLLISVTMITNLLRKCFINIYFM